MTPDQIAAIRDRHTRGRGAIEAWIPLEVVRSLEDVPALLDLLAERDAEVERLRAQRDGDGDVDLETTQRENDALAARLDAVRSVHARYFDPETSEAGEGIEPEDVWRFDRDMRALLAPTPETTTTEGETP
ncbi:hypothetical protein EDD28_2438 [Salana multivorans]|uniref:Uncharacterized protein n=1 Tax=Salana multivorans TaxID=120377 RepID=A0A3N2DDG6_9MICO|nr:hypothetical protein [Salana multivorans]ROR97829.1 hypothetical protein EDD28_2438 [Salana multivorans]